MREEIRIQIILFSTWPEQQRIRKEEQPYMLCPSPFQPTILIQPLAIQFETNWLLCSNFYSQALSHLQKRHFRISTIVSCLILRVETLFDAASLGKTCLSQYIYVLSTGRSPPSPSEISSLKSTQQKKLGVQIFTMTEIIRSQCILKGWSFF